MKRLYLVIINGFSGSGKDEFCSMCQEFMLKQGKSTWVKHSSDFAKSVLYGMNWDGERTPEVRQLLTDLVSFGEITGSNLEDLYIFVKNNSMFSTIFYHERNPIEIQKIVDNYKNQIGVTTITVLVNRGMLSRIEKDKWNLDEFTYDVLVNNFGTLEDLKVSAESFCKDFLLEV